MEISVEQSCPSCGAGILLSEDDRLIRCEYCEVSNFRVGGGMRYTLPLALPRNLDPKHVIFLPYLRLKGALFNIDASGVRHKIIDTTCSGVRDTDMPASLGLKPQAMKVNPVVASTSGLFVPQQLPMKDIFSHAIKITEIFASKKEKASVLHRSFIGETVSRIYQPYFVQAGKMYDAVTGRAAGPADVLRKYSANATPSKSKWEPVFISTLCPACGGMLSGERDSLVLKCENCQKAWEEFKGRFQDVPYTITPSRLDNAHFLPFWELDIGGHSDIKSFGDYLRFTNQPLVVLDRFNSIPLKIFIPAFKVNPKAYLQLAAQVTMSQLKLADAHDVVNGLTVSVRLHKGNHYPVTLASTEAIQSIKPVLGATTIDKKRSLPEIRHLRISISQARLNFLPFTQMSHDWVQEATKATVSSAALKYGRRL